MDVHRRFDESMALEHAAQESRKQERIPSPVSLKKVDFQVISGLPNAKTLGKDGGHQSGPCAGIETGLL
jgi:hypothetical protein